MANHRKAICLNGHDTTIVGRYPSNRRCRACLRSNDTGWTQERWDELMSAQGSCCAVCGEPFVGIGRIPLAPAADHDHVTGSPRGILHRRCNTLLGYALDSPDRLRQAAEYLETHGG